MVARAAFVLPATATGFFALVWPLYHLTKISWGKNPNVQNHWWAFTVLYFSFFAWCEFVAFGCRLWDYLPPVNALLFGMMAAVVVVLREPVVTATLETIGFGYAYLFVLIPALLLLTTVEVMMVAREDKRISAGGEV
jgi:hypothetical protein